MTFWKIVVPDGPKIGQGWFYKDYMRGDRGRGDIGYNINGFGGK